MQTCGIGGAFAQLRDVSKIICDHAESSHLYLLISFGGHAMIATSSNTSTESVPWVVAAAHGRSKTIRIVTDRSLQAIARANPRIDHTMSYPYYSSLPKDVKAEKEGRAQSFTPTKRRESPSPSPRKTIESAATSISNAVVTSMNSARRIKDAARSFVPRKLLAAQCTQSATGGKAKSAGEWDEGTPVIYYPDEVPVVKPDSVMTFVDPFSFGGGRDYDQKDVSSVIPVRLFPEDAMESKGAMYPIFEEGEEEKGDCFGGQEVVTFDCPMFTFNDLDTNVDDTSIEISEAIKSINAMSVKEIQSFRESISAAKKGKAAKDDSLEIWMDSESILPWEGFKRSQSFTTCEWEPNDDDDMTVSASSN